MFALFTYDLVHLVKDIIFHLRSMGNSGEFAPQWSMDLNGSGSGSRGSFKGQSSRSIDRISIRYGNLARALNP